MKNIKGNTQCFRSNFSGKNILDVLVLIQDRTISQIQDVLAFSLNDWPRVNSISHVSLNIEVKTPSTSQWIHYLMDEHLADSSDDAFYDRLSKTKISHGI